MKTLTKTQKAILALAIVPMVAVGVAGGIGTYSNISSAYGSGTAVGALAAGEGATAVLAMLLLGLTLLGQSAPRLIHAGLWALPGVAAVMGGMAATEGMGQTVVYAATPMAITASAEGIAFLARRIVIHQTGRDADAEVRAASVVSALAYHRARTQGHPSRIVRWMSERKSWRLARKISVTADVRLGENLMDVQRARITDGADAALMAMFTVPAGHPALTAASAPAGRELTPGADRVRTDDDGDPADTPADQGGSVSDIRPDVRKDTDDGDSRTRMPSIASAVRGFVEQGKTDVAYISSVLTDRYGPDDPKKFKETVGRYVRDAKRPAGHSGAYL